MSSCSDEHKSAEGTACLHMQDLMRKEAPSAGGEIDACTANMRKKKATLGDAAYGQYLVCASQAPSLAVYLAQCENDASQAPP